MESKGFVIAALFTTIINVSSASADNEVLTCSSADDTTVIVGIGLSKETTKPTVILHEDRCDSEVEYQDGRFSSILTREGKSSDFRYAIACRLSNDLLKEKVRQFVTIADDEIVFGSIDQQGPGRNIIDRRTGVWRHADGAKSSCEKRPTKKQF
jgi:hypothetical protein